MIITQIAAVTENWIIGRNNALPWNMPEDMAWFRKVTMGHTVIMGRRNYEANGNKALPGRNNIVITRQNNLVLGDAMVVHSIEQALKVCSDEGSEEVFIVGGGEIYRLGMKFTDRIYLTVIHTRLEGDATYPELDPDQWERVHEDPHRADERNQYDYTFFILERNKNKKS